MKKKMIHLRKLGLNKEIVIELTEQKAAIAGGLSNPDACLSNAAGNCPTQQCSVVVCLSNAAGNCPSQRC